MAALLLKSYGRFTFKCLKRVPNCSGIGTRKANFHIATKNQQIKCDDSPPYTIRLALPPDYDNVLEFMCESYYKPEPIIANIGLEGTEAPPAWRHMMYDQIKAGYSIIAENRENCIIGAALNYPFHISEKNKMYELACTCEQGPIRDILEFYDHITKVTNIWERCCVTMVFEQSSIAVSSDYQGLGIAKRMIQECWILARDCGFGVFRIDCNSSYIRRIANGFGWPMIWSKPFGQYVNDSRIIFKHVKEPHTVCAVFVDHLRYCKTYCPPYKQCKTRTPPPT